MDGILSLGVLIYGNAAICTKSLLTILRPLDKRRMVRLMSLKLLCGFLAFGLLCGSIEYYRSFVGDLVWLYWAVKHLGRSAFSGSWSTSTLGLSKH